MQVRSCRAKTKSGKRCRANAGKRGYCYFHSPAYARLRAQAHRKGGQAKLIRKVSGSAPQIVDVASVLALVNKVILDAWELNNSPARARVLLQAASESRAALSVGEIEQRIAQLEDLVNVTQNQNR